VSALQTADIPPAEATAREGTWKVWQVVTTVLMLAIFSQAITAGLLLRGDGWAQTFHRSVAGVLVAATFLAGIVALATLRAEARGRRMGTLLVVIAVGLVAQYATGTAATEGTDVLWIHVPLGVGLIGLMDHVQLLATGKMR
jgi:heme A synthase